MDGLDVQNEAIANEFLSSQFKRSQQSDLACDLTDQSRRLALMKAEDRQFGIKATAMRSTAAAGAWRMVKSGNPKEQATQQANTAVP